MKHIFLGLILLFSASFAGAQDTEKWDINDPQRSLKTVKFTTNEGTWMSVDVSPDGQTLVFDLLGDIYTMPIGGGKAKKLRGGMAWECQPRFSPDGQYISFTSDLGGGDNIWTLRLADGQATQITKEDFRLLNNANWTPDGQYLVARKHFTHTRSLGAGAIWMYHIGGGSGTELVPAKNEQQDINEPMVSPDGRYVYYVEDMYEGGYFQYNKDPNKVIYAIKRYDRQEGKTETVIHTNGGAMRPQLNRKGDQLAYIRRVRNESVLYIFDLKTGLSRPVFRKLTKDQSEAWAIFGPFTGYNWTPDDQDIIIYGEGKLHRVNTQTGQSVIIPFEAEIEQQVATALRFKHQVAPEQFTAKAIRHLTTSPDGKKIYFHAVGHLYEQNAEGGKAQRLFNDQHHFEYEPQVSPDGRYLVYVSWSDAEKGKIWKYDLKKRQKTAFDLPKGMYREPQFSPDGKMLVFRKEAGNNQQGAAYTTEAGIYLMPSTGGTAKRISKEGAFARFDATGTRVFYQTGGYYFGALKKAYHSVNLEGLDKKTHFTSKYTNTFVPSPDNKYIAFTELYKVYIAPFPQTGQPQELSATNKYMPIRQVAKDAGYNLHWSADGQQLKWTLGETVYEVALKDCFTFVAAAPDSLPEPVKTGRQIDLKINSDLPKGKLALTNARIITGNQQDEVIEKGHILVENNHITAIGADIEIPEGTETIDLAGKTVMAGMVDAHAHLGSFRLGMSAQQNWPYYTNLAFGVTTAHDPSANSEMIFNQAEMVRAGEMVGPRVYSTGNILYGADGDFKAHIQNLDDARFAIKRSKAWGATSVKSYNQPRREQRQMVLKAAEEMEIMVVPEGGSTFFHNMTMVMDGHTGIEHNIPVAPLYKDVIEFWKNTEVGYTPTLIVNYGGLNGEYYWYQESEVWKNEHLMTFTPRSVIDPRAIHRTMAPQEDYDHGYILTSESAHKLQEAGVKVNMGAHGQIQGIGAHWEMWMLQQGGMSNLEAIKSATIQPAHYLGLDDDIGSLEKGKLADLIILSANPLENIRNSEKVEKVMINGRLYDAKTMHEIGLHPKQRAPFYWEQQQPEGLDLPHENSETHGHCSCGL
ncbi:amidohydrolase family protein [Persicobacter psychrovividus]|uniref:Bifunctional TolB-family protein/amidohydrolase n=1 Tax=Persicobacter psychrovividus TaxID=387638 RepID=A0ABM7VJ45_9BACT|nr:bifunctional TolB-family protein/amidohydrolase [Persicobacter psychrovividus]